MTDGPIMDDFGDGSHLPLNFGAEIPPEDMIHVGWVTFEGVKGKSEPGQAFLHGHLPDGWGGRDGYHGRCVALFARNDDVPKEYRDAKNS